MASRRELLLEWQSPAKRPCGAVRCLPGQESQFDQQTHADALSEKSAGCNGGSRTSQGLPFIIKRPLILGSPSSLSTVGLKLTLHPSTSVESLLNINSTAGARGGGGVCKLCVCGIQDLLPWPERGTVHCAMLGEHWGRPFAFCAPRKLIAQPIVNACMPGTEREVTSSGCPCNAG